MLVQEVKSELCPSCQVAYTSNIVETVTRRGSPVRFYCCLRCQGRVIDALERERDEMDLEEEVIKRVRGSMESQSSPVHTNYSFVPSAEAKRKKYTPSVQVVMPKIDAPPVRVVQEITPTLSQELIEDEGFPLMSEEVRAGLQAMIDAFGSEVEEDDLETEE